NHLRHDVSQRRQSYGRGYRGRTRTPGRRARPKGRSLFLVRPRTKDCPTSNGLCAFFPSAVATTATQLLAKLDPNSLSALAEALAERLQPSSPPAVPADVKAPSDNSEAPALHAKIDLLRDLFRNN